MKTSPWLPAIALGLFAGCTAPADRSTPVHDSLLPRNGTVVEYWSNGSVRRERVYRDGAIVSAIERYPNGSVAYEVDADSVSTTKPVETTRRESRRRRGGT